MQIRDSNPAHAGNGPVRLDVRSARASGPEADAAAASTRSTAPRASQDSRWAQLRARLQDTPEVRESIVAAARAEVANGALLTPSAAADAARGFLAEMQGSMNG